MTERPNNSFSGADESMGAASLPHAQFVTLPEPLPLHLGGQLDDIQVAYETYGQLNAAKDNAILICHALTGDSHVARHTPDDTLGWWDCLVGPGKHIDTDQYFVICSNALGGCRGTTGPSSIDPATGQAYGAAFPEVTTEDMVAAQAGLIDALGIDQLRCVVGGSMGGHQAMRWAVMYPNRVRGVIGVATSPRLSSQSLAFDIVGRNAIRHDPQFEQSGQSPQGGLAIARMLGHITYLSSRAMSEKFEATRNQPRDVDTNFEKMFSVGSYLAYKGQQFVERFDANSYLTLSTAMDRFDLGGTPEALRETFAPSTCRWLIISFSDDWLFPEWQSRQMVQGLVDAGKHVSYCNVESQCGHDAFLLEDDLATYGGLAEAFLKNCKDSCGTEECRQDSCGTGELAHAPTSVFGANRLDYARLLDLIGESESVLDLGCGGGGMLRQLAGRSGHAKLQGVELDEQRILHCVHHGLDVIQADLNKGLELFSDNHFDIALLSQTLQTIYDVDGLISELLRVGRRTIVSVPNFAYHKLTDMLVGEGRTPEAGLLHYAWFNTPNIRVLTLKDFERYCQDKGITIEQCIALDTEAGQEVPPESDPNRNADMAIFVLSR